MKGVWLKCYEKNWNNGKCPDLKVCSQEKRCIREHWITCYRKNYRSKKCQDCPALPACINEKEDDNRRTRTAINWMKFIGFSQMEK